MKVLLRSMIIITILSLVVGCQQDSTTVETENPNATEDMKDFIEPEPSDSLKYTKTVTEYLYYRTQAVVNNDMDILWNQYPGLKDSIDFKKGINVEKYVMESLNEHFDLIDANYNIESYERIKVKTIDDHNVIVLVHGSISYLRQDFQESGGEHVIKVFLEKTNNQWTVVKTDEYTQSEYKEWFNIKNN